MMFEVTVIIEAPESWTCGDVGEFVDGAIADARISLDVFMDELWCKKVDHHGETLPK